jgi:multisubunit Na+/H+ antiporter MnhC subunit
MVAHHPAPHRITHMSHNNLQRNEEPMATFIIITQIVLALALFGLCASLCRCCHQTGWKPARIAVVRSTRSLRR